MGSARPSSTASRSPTGIPPSDCLGLLDHLGIDRAVVGGMSQGGFVSLRVALLAPERVRGLILLDTQAGAEDPAIVAGYDQMRDMWLSVGPVDELADDVANIIIGDPAVNPVWIAKWQARPKELFAQPVRSRWLRATTSPIGSARSRVRRSCPRHRGHRDHDGSGRDAGGGLVRCGTGGQGRRRARRQPHEPGSGQRGASSSSSHRSATDRVASADLRRPRPARDRAGCRPRRADRRRGRARCRPLRRRAATSSW